MADLRDLGATAQQLLDLMVAQFATMGIDLPVSQFVSPGSIPAWDGEQFTCNLLRIEQGQPGLAVGGSPYRATYFATFSLSLIREIPALFNDGQPGAMVPAPEDTDLVGKIGLDDGAALILAATAIHESYTFTDPQEGFEVGPVQTIGPSGGLAGATIQISVSVR